MVDTAVGHHPDGNPKRSRQAELRGGSKNRTRRRRDMDGRVAPRVQMRALSWSVRKGRSRVNAAAAVVGFGRVPDTIVLPPLRSLRSLRVAVKGSRAGRCPVRAGALPKRARPPAAERWPTRSRMKDRPVALSRFDVAGEAG